MDRGRGARRESHAREGRFNAKSAHHQGARNLTNALLPSRAASKVANVYSFASAPIARKANNEREPVRIAAET